MRKYFEAVAAGLVIFLFSACDGNEKKDKAPVSDVSEYAKKHPGLGAGIGTFSITEPENWIKNDTALNGIQLTTITSPIEGVRDNFKENINIVTETVKGLDYKQYAEVNLKIIKVQMPDIVIISEEETKVGDEPAKAVMYSMKYGIHDLKNTAYFLAKNGFGYVITCAAPATKFDKYKKEFVSCVNSFKINK